MTYRYRSEYAEMLRTEGEAAAMARRLLWLLDGRGVEVPDDVRERVTACTDIAVLETWIDRAVHADRLSEVFRSGLEEGEEAGGDQGGGPHAVHVEPGAAQDRQAEHLVDHQGHDTGHHEHGQRVQGRHRQPS